MHNWMKQMNMTRTLFFVAAVALTGFLPKQAIAQLDTEVVVYHEVSGGGTGQQASSASEPIRSDTAFTSQHAFVDPNTGALLL